MKRVTVIVAGLPVPQGSMKAINNVVMHNNGGKIAAWRASIQDAIHRQHGEEIELMDGPLWLSAAFRLQRPQKLTKKREAEGPIGKNSGDLSKLLRCIEDALTGVLITDDSRIVHIKDLTKAWAPIGGQPGVVFTVGEVVKSC